MSTGKPWQASGYAGGLVLEYTPKLLALSRISSYTHIFT